MKWQRLFAIAATLGVASVIGGAMVIPSNRAWAAQVQMSFSEDILPIFKGRCIGCHQPGGAGYEKSGLDLRTFEGLMKGTKYGPMVIPGDPDISNLIWLLDWRASPELRMPHGKKKLSICDRDDIRRWILQGAKDN